METKSTDKEILIKGLKQLGLSLLLMFIGPSFLYLINSLYYIFDRNGWPFHSLKKLFFSKENWLITFSKLHDEVWNCCVSIESFSRKKHRQSQFTYL